MPVIHKTSITKDIKKASDAIMSWQCVAFWTETVYWLWADARDGNAVSQIFTAKWRPSDNPLIVHCADIAWVMKYVSSPSELWLLILRKFSPWPLTVIFDKKKNIADNVTWWWISVWMRIPDNKIALDFLSLCDCPLAAPSANISWRPSPTSAQMVYTDLNWRIPYILDTGYCEWWIESTVIKVEWKKILILRPWLITAQDIATIVSDDISVTHAYDTKHESPWTRYKHYSPWCEIILFERDELHAIPDRENIWIMAQSEILASCTNRDNILFDRWDSLTINAHRLYWLYSQADRAKCQTLFVQRLPEAWLGLAIMNRVKRSAEK